MHDIQSSNTAQVKLHIRERRPQKGNCRNVPLLLVHGATVSSVLWDNPLEGWSWMDKLAADGFHVFAVDLRGYGRSSRPECFDSPPAQNQPYATAEIVKQDVVDAINYISEFTGCDEIDLLGCSWGTIICGKLIAENPEINVRRLVLYAPLYSEPNQRPTWLSKPTKTIANGTSIGAYRYVSGEDLRTRWDDEIPVTDKSSWRPNGVLEALVDNSLQEDEEYGGNDSKYFRVPNGTIVDLQNVYNGIPLYDSHAISIPTLLMRGSADPVSTHEDATRLFESLASRIKRYTIIGNGAHFMIAENKIGEVHSGVTAFLSESF